MTALTTKRSSQSLMLRVLKVVLQLREAARKSAKKPATSARVPGQPRTRGFFNLIHNILPRLPLISFDILHTFYR